MENRKIRWGLLGAGIILDRWMKGAMQVDDMEIVAVSSRTSETAEKMAEKFNIPEAMTYDEMLARDDIDVVYIPVPHTAHKELAIRAMKAGKNVLVEKPAGINAHEWEEMVACAKETNVFLMEAFWTKFNPMIPKIQEYLCEDGIGEVRMVSTNFSYRSDDFDSRLFDPERAGGSLLDVGVYNLHFNKIIFGKNPVSLIGTASIDTDELHLQVDEQAAYIARYDKGELGMMCNAIRTEMLDTAFIYGTKGYIVVPEFWRPSRMEVVIGEEHSTIEMPIPQKIPGIQDEGYQFEIRYVNQCIRDGVKESPVVTWQDTWDVLSQCDKLRRDWGLIYPGEK